MEKAKKRKKMDGKFWSTFFGSLTFGPRNICPTDILSTLHTTKRDLIGLSTTLRNIVVGQTSFEQMSVDRKTWSQFSSDFVQWPIL
jgi:hypothetical protein